MRHLLLPLALAAAGILALAACSGDPGDQLVVGMELEYHGIARAGCDLVADSDSAGASWSAKP